MRAMLFLAPVALALGQSLPAQAVIEQEQEEQDAPAAMNAAVPYGVSPSDEAGEPFAASCPADETDNDAASDDASLSSAPPVQDYDPSPAMWKIADEDTTIYLLGTFHVLPEGFRWRTPLLDSIIDGVDEVVFESREDDDPAQDDEVTLDKIQLLTLIQKYRAEVPLSQRISDRNRPKLLKLLKDAKIPLSRVEYLPPMMTMFGIAVSMFEAQGSQSQFGVETVIEKEFRDSGRPISAIEDPIQVLENLFKIDEVTLIAALEESLEEWDGCSVFGNDGDGVTDWSSEHAWAKGEMEDVAWADTFDDPFSKSFYDVLLVDRNREWASWVKQRMEQPGNLLLAVGAGHMEGPDSLVLMLEADGISVERVQ